MAPERGKNGSERDGELLDVRRLSQEYGNSASFWNKLRCQGGGPNFLKMGHRVRYVRADVVRWFTERRRASTSATEPPANAPMLPITLVPLPALLKRKPARRKRRINQQPRKRTAKRARVAHDDGARP